MHAGESLWNLYGLVTGLERKFSTDPSLLKVLADARRDLEVIGALIMVPPPSDAEVAGRIPQFEVKSAVAASAPTQNNRSVGMPRKLTANGQTARALCVDILQDMDDMPEKAREFADSVREKTKSMLERIDRFGDATDRMVTALENMRHGQLKWLNRV